MIVACVQVASRDQLKYRNLFNFKIRFHRTEQFPSNNPSALKTQIFEAFFLVLHVETLNWFFLVHFTS